MWFALLPRRRAEQAEFGHAATELAVQPIFVLAGFGGPTVGGCSDVCGRLRH
jgi:hypothetical protein